ncbi:MAG TPA: hypothetical protein VIG44_03840 [Thermomicrobiales bacterium]
MDDRYAARNVFAVSDLPPASARHSQWMRRFNRLYAWGIAVVVGAIIVPQYMYLVTLYLHGPAEEIARKVIAPIFAVGSLASLALLVSTPIRIVTHFRERSARGNDDCREEGQPCAAGSHPRA